MNEPALNLKKRRDIYHYITKNPGIHLRGLERKLGISLGDLRYHLEYLENDGLITSRKDGYKKTYYSTSKTYACDRDTLALLRQMVPRRIILFLIENPNTTFEDIRKELNKSKSTLSFHLKKLKKCGIIKIYKEENKNLYSVKDPDHIISLIITYKASFLDSAIDRVVDMYL